MKWEMEVLSSYLSNASWLIDESKKTKWSQAENKMFENALAVYDKDTPDRWQRVAAMIPGKTVADVIKQYKELEDDVSNIEAGLVPIPGYNSSSVFTLEWVNNNVYDGYKHAYYGYSPCGKRGPGSRASDHERKKGVPWTEEEHKLFLMGLKKYGKGDWRNISRNFVITRTPTQVASHAQKYFIRQLSGGKDKRRASIHDITTVNIDNQTHLSPDHTNTNKPSNSPDHSTMTVQSRRSSAPAIQKAGHFQWEQHNSNGGAISFDYMQGNRSMSPYEVGSYGFKNQGQNLQSRDFLEKFIGSQSIGFEIQSDQHYPHG